MDQSLVEKIASDLLTMKSELKEHKIRSVGDAIRFISFVIKFVEQVSYKGEIKSTDKKELAVALINRFVDVPYVPEFIEGRLISIGIDLVIEFVNQHVGHDWLVKLGGV